MVCVMVLVAVILTQPLVVVSTPPDTQTDTPRDRDSESNHAAPKGCYYKGRYHHGNWEDGCDYLCTCLDPQTGFYKCRRRCPRYKSLPLNCKFVLPLDAKCCKTPHCIKMNLDDRRKSVELTKPLTDTSVEHASVIKLHENQTTASNQYRNPDTITNPKSFSMHKSDVTSNNRDFKYETFKSDDMASNVTFDLKHENLMFMGKESNPTNLTGNQTELQHTSKTESTVVLRHNATSNGEEVLVNTQDKSPQANAYNTTVESYESKTVKEEVINITIDTVESIANSSDSDSVHQESTNSDTAINDKDNLVQPDLSNLTGTTPATADQDSMHTNTDRTSLSNDTDANQSVPDNPDVSSQSQSNDTNTLDSSVSGWNGVKEDNDNDKSSVKHEQSVNDSPRNATLHNNISSESGSNDSQFDDKNQSPHGLDAKHQPTQQKKDGIHEKTVSTKSTGDKDSDTSPEVGPIKAYTGRAVQYKPITPTYTGANITLKYKDKEWSMFVKELSKMFLEVSRMKKRNLQTKQGGDSGRIDLFQTKTPVVTTVKPPAIKTYKPRDYFYGNDEMLQQIRRDFIRNRENGPIRTSNNTGCFYHDRRYSPGETWQNRCNKTCMCSSSVPGRYFCQQERCLPAEQVPPGCELKTQRTGCCGVLVCPRFTSPAPDPNTGVNKILNTKIDLREDTVKFVRTSTGIIRLQYVVDGTGRWVGQLLPTIKENTKALCHYKKRKYVTGEVWHDGCYSCRCVNGMFGRYTCHVRCPSFTNIPVTCAIHVISADQCCPILRCSPTSPDVRHVSETSTRTRINGRRITLTQNISGNKAVMSNYNSRVNGDGNNTMVSNYNSRVNGDGNNTVVSNYNSRVNGDGNNTVVSNYNSRVNRDGNDTVMSNYNSRVNGDGNNIVMSNYNSRVNLDGNNTVMSNYNSRVNRDGNNPVMSNYNSRVNLDGNNTVMSNYNRRMNRDGNNQVMSNYNSRVNLDGNNTVMSNYNSRVNRDGNNPVMSNYNSRVNRDGNNTVMSNYNSRINLDGNNTMMSNYNSRVEIDGDNTVMSYTNSRMNPRNHNNDDRLTRLSRLMQLIRTTSHTRIPAYNVSDRINTSTHDMANHNTHQVKTVTGDTRRGSTVQRQTDHGGDGIATQKSEEASHTSQNVSPVRTAQLPLYRNRRKHEFLGLKKGTSILSDIKRMHFNRNKLNVNEKLRIQDSWQKRLRKSFSRNSPRGVNN